MWLFYLVNKKALKLRQRYLCCQGVGLAMTIATVAAFLTINFIYFTPWALKFSQMLKNVAKNHQSSTGRENKITHVVDQVWAFEITPRLYDNRTDVPTKVILLWTFFFGNWSAHFGRNHGPYVDLETFNSSKRCYYTRDRTDLERASALIFHGRDLKFDDLPKKRFPWQRWIFHLLESPVHSGFNDNEWNKANALQFNWTMTYSKLGNVYHPYGYIRRSKKPLDLDAMNAKIDGFAKSFKSRPKDAVWVVSNCQAHSLRHFFVEKLVLLGIKIDIFGKCGNVTPDGEWKTKGEKQFFSRYRFVLALENSLCEDYITEKGFHAFYANFIAGPIPIVYNGGNDEDFFPNGSYIDMRSFEAMSDLVSRMKRLSNSDENSPELLRYYDWQKELNPAYDAGYELETFSDMYVLSYSKRSGWRSLCRALWDNDTGTSEVPIKNYQSSYVKDIRAQLGQCFGPNLLPLARDRRQTL